MSSFRQHIEGVGTNLGLHEALLPWYRNASIAAGFVLLYWLGLGYFLRRLARGERTRETLLAELEEPVADGFW